MEKAFLALVRLGIGNAATEKLPNRIVWDEVEALAEKQGMLGIIYDAVERLKTNTDCTDNTEGLPPLTTWLRWMGKVLHGYEQRYGLYRKSVDDLAAWYHAHGYRMMLLKGLACGMNWPKPEHRPYGDIDIWLFGRQQAADKEMFEELKKFEGFKIDNSHHHHTVFQWQGFSVENHYDFVNVHHHKSNEELEALLKSLVFRVESLESVDSGEFKVYSPPANFNALFLLRHAMSHYASTGMNLRQLLDWAFFVEKHGEEVDWEWLRSVLKKYGMLKMFDVMNAICVEDLGFDKGCWSKVDSWGVDSNLKQRVLDDIISPEFSEKAPKQVWKRIPFRYRRWKSNEWKHELCYNESMSSSFWSGVKNHLLKPASI